MKVPLLLLLLATATHWLSPVAAQVADIVTQDFFDRIINNGRADSSCPGRVFYTRQAFLDAAASFQGFGTTGDSDVMRREIAAFFANVKHETGSLCDIEETNDQGEHCDQSFVDRYPCAPGKSYYGRGPLQLTWNYNYGAAGASIGFDGLAEPEKLATDAGISFKAAVWFWMSQCHNYIVSGQGFGETIRAINSRECGGGAADIVANRVSYYQDFCAQLGVAPGDNLTC